LASTVIHATTLKEYEKSNENQMRGAKKSRQNNSAIENGTDIVSWRVAAVIVLSKITDQLMKCLRINGLS
jgi:hypothetical protein